MELADVSGQIEWLSRESSALAEALTEIVQQLVSDRVPDVSSLIKRLESYQQHRDPLLEQLGLASGSTLKEIEACIVCRTAAASMQQPPAAQLARELPVERSSSGQEESSTQQQACFPPEQSPADSRSGHSPPPDDAADLERAARRVRDATSSGERYQALSDLVWVLLINGRDGLAWHLSRALEALDVGVPFLESRMVRAWSAGQRLLFPRGTLATMLVEELQEMQAEVDADQNGDWARARVVFRRAAALRAALVAPETRAGMLIRNNNDTETRTAFDNYCVSLATCGEQLNGQFPGALKRGWDARVRETELHHLQEELRQWLSESAGWTVQFRPMEPLFVRPHWSLHKQATGQSQQALSLFPRWMQVLRLVNELTEPVLQDRASDLTQVRSLVNRVSTSVVLGDPGETPNTSTAIVVPLPEMQLLLEEAVTFAQRWISLHSQSTPDQQAYLPEETEDLLNHLRDRAASVQSDVDRLVKQSTGAERRAWQCLQRSLAGIAELLDPDHPLPTREPVLREVLGVEFLQARPEVIDEYWLPQLPPQEIAAAIVEIVLNNVPDWPEVFQRLLAVEKYSIAADVLELDVWSDLDRERLQRELAEQVEQQRIELQAQLDETANLLEEAARAGSLCDDSREKFEARLSTIERQLEEQCDPAVASGDLRDLRHSLTVDEKEHPQA